MQKCYHQEVSKYNGLNRIEAYFSFVNWQFGGLKLASIYGSKAAVLLAISYSAERRKEMWKENSLLLGAQYRSYIHHVVSPTYMSLARMWLHGTSLGGRLRNIWVVDHILWERKERRIIDVGR